MLYFLKIKLLDVSFLFFSLYPSSSVVIYHCISSLEWIFGLITDILTLYITFRVQFSSDGYEHGVGIQSKSQGSQRDSNLKTTQKDSVVGFKTLKWMEMVHEMLGSRIFLRLTGVRNESEEAVSERQERTWYTQPLKSQGDPRFKEWTSHHFQYCKALEKAKWEEAVEFNIPEGTFQIEQSLRTLNWSRSRGWLGVKESKWQ